MLRLVFVVTGNRAEEKRYSRWLLVGLVVLLLDLDGDLLLLLGVCSLPLLIVVVTC